MLSNKPVLPNFIKTVLFSCIAVLSVSAFAGNKQKGEEKIGDLKDMTTTESTLSADEKAMIDLKSSMAEDKADAKLDEVSEEELATKAESLNPEK